MLAGACLSLLASASIAAGPARTAAGTTFTLVSSPTCATGETLVGQGCFRDVQGDKLKVGAAGTSGSADFATSPAEGGAQWKAHFTWHVPGTLVAGTKVQGGIQIGVTVSDVKPDQPLQQGVKGFAPGFAQQIIASYPATATASQSFDYTLPAGQTSAFTITIEFVSSTLTYHYAPKKTTPVCKRPNAAYAPAASQAGCTAAVSFLFTAGGRPKSAPKRVLDVRIAGHGSGTVDLDGQGDPIGPTLVLKTARVVVERDYAGDDLEDHTQRLVFALAKDGDTALHGAPPGPRAIRTHVKLVDSSDPSCPEGRHGPREARLYIGDRGNASGFDVVGLTVDGCDHHDYAFKGTKRVNVVILVK